MGASQLYSWDEVGRLVRARRWDQAALASDVSSTTPAVDLQYHYAAGDSRVLKTARDPGGQEVHTAYVFPSLELRRAEFDTDAPGDYTLDSSTEVAYLFANGVRLARLVHQPLDSAGDGKLLRVFFELGDHLGSTSVALDKDTGELVERSTYQAYGGAESSYRPSKWGDFREDYRFTGKEEDVEVGLTYFGKRFYNALLQRWVSPDPLEVHQPGQADANLYAYVSGAALKNVDPLGLQSAFLTNPQAVTPRTAANPPAQEAPGLLDDMVAAWNSFRSWTTSKLVASDMHQKLEEGKKLDPPNSGPQNQNANAAQIHSLNDSLVEQTPGATVNMVMLAGGSLKTGKPVLPTNVRIAGCGDCSAHTAVQILRRTGRSASVEELVGKFGLPEKSTGAGATWQDAFLKSLSWFQKVGIEFERGNAALTKPGNYAVFLKGGREGGHVVFAEVTEDSMVLIDTQRNVQLSGARGDATMLDSMLGRTGTTEVGAVRRVKTEPSPTPTTPQKAE